MIHEIANTINMMHQEREDLGYTRRHHIQPEMKKHHLVTEYAFIFYFHFLFKVTYLRVYESSWNAGHAK